MALFFNRCGLFPCCTTGASPDPTRRPGAVTASSADACRLPPEPPRVQPGIGTRHLASAHRIVPAHASRPLILRPCSGGAGMVLLIRVDHRACRARLTAAVRPVACIGADGSICGSFCRPPGMRHAPSPTAPPTARLSPCNPANHAPAMPFLGMCVVFVSAMGFCRSPGRTRGAFLG